MARFIVLTILIALPCRFYTWSWATNFTSLPSFVMKSLQRSYDYIAMDRSALCARKDAEQIAIRASCS